MWSPCQYTVLDPCNAGLIVEGMEERLSLANRCRAGGGFFVEARGVSPFTSRIWCSPTVHLECSHVRSRSTLKPPPPNCSGPSPNGVALDPRWRPAQAERS